MPFLHKGVPLEKLNTDVRDHHVRIKGRSHVRLTEDECEATLTRAPAVDRSRR